MISKYFVKGTTYNWTAPTSLNPNQDGTVVVSGQSPGPAMTYAGLDNEIVYGPMPGPLAAMYKRTTSPASLGLNANQNVPYVWVNYVLGRTAYQQTAGTDVLTGFMSGCWIVTWTEAGNRHVGHIGTVESAAKDQPPNSTVKATFSNKFTGAAPVGSQLKGFNPAAAWNMGDIKSVCKEAGQNWGNLAGNAKLMALVTQNDHFYTVLIIRKSPNLWICGGAKRVSGEAQAGVLHALQ